MVSRRRQFLATASGLSVAALAGCSSVSKIINGKSGNGDSSGFEDQKAVVDKFITAVNDNDLETVEETVTGWAAGGFTEDNIGEYTFEREELRRPDNQRRHAWLKTQLTITHNGETRTDETSFQLLESEDGWSIGQILVVGGFIVGGTTLGPPPVFLEGSYDPGATSSDDTGVLTLTHGGGGVVPAEGMQIRGTIVNPPGASPDVTTDGTTLGEATDRTRFAQGDDFTVGVQSDYEVLVTFTKEETDSTVILGEFTRS